MKQNKLEKIFSFVTYKRLSIAIMIILAFVVAVFFRDSFARTFRSVLYFFESIAYYFRTITGTAGLGAPVNPSIALGSGDVNVPTSFTQYLYAFRSFSVAIFNRDIFLFYLVDVILFLLQVIRFISFLPMIWLITWAIKRLTLIPGEHEYGQDTRALMRWKRFEALTIFPIKLYFLGYFIFLKQRKRYFIIPLLIMLFGLNFLAMGIDVISWYFYYVFNLFDVMSIASPLASILFTLVPFFVMLKKFGTFLLLYGVFELIRTKDAIALLKKMQEHNEELCKVLGVATFFLGPPGCGKTQMLTSVAIDLEKYIREKLLSIIMKYRKNFPFFPWDRLERWLNKRTGVKDIREDQKPAPAGDGVKKASLWERLKLKKQKGPKQAITDTEKEKTSENPSEALPATVSDATHPTIEAAKPEDPSPIKKETKMGPLRDFIVNRDQIDEEIRDIWKHYSEKNDKSILFGMDGHYPTEYYNGNGNVKLVEAMSSYAQAYFIYNAERPVADGTYPIRFDPVLKPGPFKLYDYDYFKHDNRLMDAYSKYSAIMKFDNWRILNPLNKEADFGRYSREVGVHAFPESDKERGNKNDYYTMDRGSTGDANQTNDGFNTAVKLERHQETIDNISLGYSLFDTQRESSVNIDLTEIAESKIRIADRSDPEMTLFGFPIDYALYHLFMDPWDEYFEKYLNKRNINTLPMHLLKGLAHTIGAIFERKVNRYSYEKIMYRHERGGSQEMAGDKSDGIYYIISAKMHAYRYVSAHYQKIFARQRLSAVDGYLQAECYKTVIMDPSEFKQQDSYFYDKLMKYTDPEGVNKEVIKDIGIK